MIEKLKTELQSTDQVRFLAFCVPGTGTGQMAAVLALNGSPSPDLPWGRWAAARDGSRVFGTSTPSAFFPFNPAKGIHLSPGSTTGKSLADSQL